jgi:hypothetical protein
MFPPMASKPSSPFLGPSTSRIAQPLDDSLFGAIAKGVIGAVGGSSGVALFGDLSWHKIILLTGAASAYAANATIDAILAGRAAKRECSLSYILSLDE